MRPVTRIESSELRVSSIMRMTLAAGIAIATKITTGMMVQMISTLVLCTMLVSGMAPWEWRKFHEGRKIITPKTTTWRLVTQIQKTSMCKA